MNNHRMKVATILAASFALGLSACPAFAAGNDDSDNALAGLGAAVPSAQLANMRGGTLVVVSSNTGADTNNSVTNSPAGSIINNESANSNTGLTTIMQNTGNNALLQSSMTVNISVQ